MINRSALSALIVMASFPAITSASDLLDSPGPGYRQQVDEPKLELHSTTSDELIIFTPVLSSSSLLNSGAPRSLSLLSTPPASSTETIVLTGPSYPEQKSAEGIKIWVRHDRSLLADFGPTTVLNLIQTCEEWRKKGTKPGIRILLYSSLPSNQDLGSILELMKNLDKHKIPFDIMIMPNEAPKYLLVP